MKPTTASQPTTALIVSLDPFGAAVSLDACSKISRLQAPQTALTSCLFLSYNQDDGFVLAAQWTGVEQSLPFCSRQAAYQAFLENASAIRRALNAALHNLRSHERLIRAGVSRQPVVPLDIFVLADLTDPLSSGVLLPILSMLQDILSSEPYGMGHLLLSTALFPAAANPAGQAQCSFEGADVTKYCALQDLSAFFNPEDSGLRAAIAQQIGAELPQAVQFQTYLFDHRKEGTLEALDQAEIQLIMANFQLALLSGRFAQHTGSSPGNPLDQPELEFSSAAVTGLIFEPDRLVRICMLRLAKEFLHSSSNQPDTGSAQSAATLENRERLIRQIVDENSAAFLDLESWLPGLCRDTPYQLTARPEAYQVDLHLADLSFEDIPKAEWVNHLRQYRAHFEAEVFSYHLRCLETNTSALKEMILQTSPQRLDTLIIQGLSQTGQVGQLRAAVQEIERMLQHRLADPVLIRPVSTCYSETDVDAGFTRLVEQLARPASRPSLRSLLRLILAEIKNPGSMRNQPERRLIALPAWISRLFYQWLHQADAVLIETRQRCIRNLELSYATRFSIALLERLHSLDQNIQGPILQVYEDLDRLQEIIQSANSQAASRQVDLPDSSFFPKVIDPAVIQWAYKRWRPPLEDMRLALVEKYGLFNDWREITPESLIERLTEYGYLIYLPPIYQLTLPELLAQRQDGHLLELLPALLANAVPLLRPNFDALGGASDSFISHTILSDPAARQEIQPWLASQTTLPAHWVFYQTSDPWTILCCQIRQRVPLSALKELLRSGQAAWEALSSAERRPYLIHPSQTAEAAHDRRAIAIPVHSDQSNAQCGVDVGDSMAGH
jgi:hypothetical protein